MNQARNLPQIFIRKSISPITLRTVSHYVCKQCPHVAHCAPWGGWWIVQWRTTWSKVCSSAPHSQAAERAIPHLCKLERQRPKPVQRWRLSRTHAVLDRAIPGGLVLMSGIKVRSLVVLSSYSAFHRWSAQSVALLLLSSDELMSYRMAGTNVQIGISIQDAVRFPLGERVRAEWSGSLGCKARRAKDTVAYLQEA